MSNYQEQPQKKPTPHTFLYPTSQTLFYPHTHTNVLIWHSVHISRQECLYCAHTNHCRINTKPVIKLDYKQAGAISQNTPKLQV